MRKKREFFEGSFYHVTSRTNDKIRVFENRLGQKILLMILEEAKDRFRFILTNFCIMPTHFHLLIQPPKEICLSVIMQWIKNQSAKRWNRIHGSTDHLWGNRYFARAIKTQQEYDYVMNYIDQNPVVAGLSISPSDWKASGAFYKSHNIEGLIDFLPSERKQYIKLLSPIPPDVSRLLPSRQLDDTLQHYGIYAEDISRIHTLIPTIPRIGDTKNLRHPPISLHYCTPTSDYFINEYDGQNTMNGRFQLSVYPHTNEYRKFDIQELKNIQAIKLDFSWRT
ncbi:MAG: transposase [Treponema sp.]|nr:transposase [Treponema sp.]